MLYLGGMAGVVLDLLMRRILMMVIFLHEIIALIVDYLYVIVGLSKKFIIFLQIYILKINIMGINT